MKKALSLILVLCLAFSLTACGGSGSSSGGSDQAAAAASKAESTAAAAASTAASAAEEAAEEAAAPAESALSGLYVTDTTYDSSSWDPIEVKYATGWASGTIVCNSMQDMFNYITEKSGGKITFQSYPDGTLLTIPEEMLGCANGVVQMCTPLQPESGTYHPLYGTAFQLMGMKECLEFNNSLLHDNPVTAPLIEEELANLGVKVLSFSSGGYNCWSSTKPITSYEDIAKTTFASDMDEEMMQRLGINAISLGDSDFYTALSRGMCDTVVNNVDGTINNRFYEVANNILIDRSCSAVLAVTINKAFWDSLNDDQRALFEEADKIRAQACMEEMEASTETEEQFLKDQGCTVNWTTEEESNNYVIACCISKYHNHLKYAETIGPEEVEKLNTITEVISEYLGYDLINDKPM